MRLFASWWERMHARHIPALALAFAIAVGAHHLFQLGHFFAGPAGFLWG